MADSSDRSQFVSKLLAGMGESRGTDARDAMEQLLPHVYDELRAMAGAQMAREAGPRTLQATALVHEAYLRLAGGQNQPWTSRRAFFQAAAVSMRRILVEEARKRRRLKRGGDQNKIPLSQADLDAPTPDHDVIALDEALKALEDEDPRKGQIVNLRYFAGLTVPETADALGLSVGTIEREWRFIKVWLCDRLEEKP